MIEQIKSSYVKVIRIPDPAGRRRKREQRRLRLAELRKERLEESVFSNEVKIGWKTPTMQHVAAGNILTGSRIG